MIRLFWNCRGARKNGLATYVRDLMGEYRFDFVCFQETIVQDFSEAMLRRIDPYMIYLWDWISTKGRSSGVLTGINLHRFDIGSRIQGEFLLQHNLWDKELEVKWNILNAYGSAQDEQKDEFLCEMAAFCEKIKEPYIIGGDFNILRFSCEKNKKIHPNKYSDIFNAIINSNGLREIHSVGGCFTWSNGQSNPTLEKLDRVLMTKEWESLFPTMHIYKKPRDMSDHNPLVLITQQPYKTKSRIFRFELNWLSHPEFLPKVKDCGRPLLETLKYWIESYSN
jgi:exonuclease III